MYKIEKLEKNKVKITMNFSKDEWDNSVELSYEQNKNKFNIQGFRKGKAPKRVIEKNYGESIFYDDAMDIIFNECYHQILDNEKWFNPIESPEVSIDKFDENGLIIVANVENMPTVNLGAYTGLTCKKATGKVEDKQIEKEIKQAQERQARFVEAERPAKMGDIVTIDFSGSIDGVKFDGGTAENHRLELGSKNFIDNFEEQIVDMKVGETKDVNVNFPAEYQVEELKGKPAVFVVTLKKVEEKQLPELNDEFASDVSEFETFEEYKNSIKQHLTESLNKKLEREDENSLIEAVVKNAEVEVPQVLVERQLDMFIRDFEVRLSYQGLKLDDYLKYANTTIEKLKEEKIEDAKTTVKTRLVLEKLIEQEKLNVTVEELNAKIQETASKYGKTIDQYKASLGEKQLAYFENDIIMDKLLKFLKENNNLE